MASFPPKEILILGSGVFGLSTAYALAQRPSFASSKITVVDRSPFPAPEYVLSLAQFLSPALLKKNSVLTNKQRLLNRHLPHNPPRLRIPRLRLPRLPRPIHLARSRIPLLSRLLRVRPRSRGQQRKSRGAICSIQPPKRKVPSSRRRRQRTPQRGRNSSRSTDWGRQWGLGICELQEWVGRRRGRDEDSA